MNDGITYFAGIDVQLSRGCAWYVLDRSKKHVRSGWITKDIPVSFHKLFMELTNGDHLKITIGIDAPRMPMVKPRTRYYDRDSGSWFEKAKESIGRECEVVINSHRIANCQWTNTLDNSPAWMQPGFEIFDALQDFPFVYEVFPSASYRMLANEGACFELCLDQFKPGIKDMLDAAVAAFTVYEYIHGRGCEVGGEDELGSIVLPRKI